MTWISVDERLPEVGKPVLVCAAQGRIVARLVGFERIWVTVPGGWTVRPTH